MKARRWWRAQFLGVGSGSTGVGVGGRVEILALGSELPDQTVELCHATLCGTDRHAVLTARIAARLPRVQPVLDCPGEQPIGYVPQVGVLVLVCDQVAQLDSLGEC